jgi:hypothetical protein
MRVQRLEARARLDDPESALARAAAEAATGDECWEEWIAEYERGEALIVRMDVALEADCDGHDVIELVNRGVWIETNVHAPNVEQQVAELATKDCVVLARDLAARGLALDQNELADMYVHVELANDVRQALGRASTSRCTASDDSFRPDS